jgi:pyrroline-5-carboxylate reductase
MQSSAAHHISNRIICIIIVIFIKAIGSSAAFVNDKGRRQQLKQPITTRCGHKHNISSTSAFTTTTNMDNDESNTSISTNDQQSKDLIPSTPLLRPIHAGFIGCGTIASSIIIGLATPEHTIHLANNGIQLSSISITRRSTSKSTMLQERFPTIVTIHEMAHEVVLNSDIIFLCILPTQVDEVLTDLKQRGLWKCDTHILISLVSTSKVDELIIKSGLRQSSVYKLICLPPIARRSGCALLQPAATTDDNIDNDISSSKDIVTSILNALGGYVECHNDSMMEAMMIPTAMMGPLYGMMRNNRDWLGELLIYNIYIYTGCVLCNFSVSRHYIFC